MEEIAKNISSKISSYNILNNLLPGILFKYLIELFTSYKLEVGNTWESIFIYYFIGMVISRVGSIIIEPALSILKLKNRKNDKEFMLIRRTSYEDYVLASEKQPIINILSETNNVYRTVISLLLCVLTITIYESFYRYVGKMVKIIALISGIILFIMSYRKQTKYITNRVETVMDELGKKK